MLYHTLLYYSTLLYSTLYSTLLCLYCSLLSIFYAVLYS